MPLIAPLLAEMGLNAAFIAGAVLSARVAIFAYQFLRNRSL